MSQDFRLFNQKGFKTSLTDLNSVGDKYINLSSFESALQGESETEENLDSQGKEDSEES